jgi:Holliday junction resolvase RusA-like endonuclease
MTEAISPAPRVSEVSFVVKGNPVSQNHAWTIIMWKPKAGSAQQPHASMKLTADGIGFKVEVARVAALVRPPEWDRENEYIVDCVYYFDTRRPDHDGPGKLIFDAMGEFDIEYSRGKEIHFEGFYKNDRQVWRSTQQKELDPTNPRTEITIRLRRPWKPLQKSLL